MAGMNDSPTQKGNFTFAAHRKVCAGPSGTVWPHQNTDIKSSVIVKLMRTIWSVDDQMEV